MSEITLIFSHYGNSDYLDFTLRCARKTNPNARLILLGDEANIEVAKKSGWEHHVYSEYKGDLLRRFNNVYRPIQGIKHNHIKNGKDWLKFVFERWFFIEEFAKREKLGRFWHFDSDTMVLQDLRPHDLALRNYDFSVQCNGMCLNGIVSTSVVSEYCAHICALFESSEYLSAQQYEFDTKNPDYAFTEMRAFADYLQKTARPWLHLLSYQENVIFDDCICQAHGFQMCELKRGQSVKRFYARNKRIYALRGNNEIEFVTLNLSWVPLYVFDWSMKALSGGNSSIDMAYIPPRDLILEHARKLKKILKRCFHFN